MPEEQLIAMAIDLLMEKLGPIRDKQILVPAQGEED
jgi:hypothetical protein